MNPPSRTTWLTGAGRPGEETDADGEDVAGIRCSTSWGTAAAVVQLVRTTYPEARQDASAATSDAGRQEVSLVRGCGFRMNGREGGLLRLLGQGGDGVSLPDSRLKYPFWDSLL